MENLEPQQYNPFPPEEEEKDAEQIEFKRYCFPELEEDHTQRERETSFWDPPIREEPKSLEDTPNPPRFEPGISNPRLAAQRDELEDLGEIEDLRDFLETKLGFKTSATTGQYSKELYRRLKPVRDQKTRNVTGVEFEGERVTVKGGKFSGNFNIKTKVAAFRTLLDNAALEFKKSVDAEIEEGAGVYSEQISENVKRDFIETLERDIKKSQQEYKDQRENQEAEIQALESKIQSLENKLKSSENKEEDYVSKIAKKDSDISKLTRELGAQAIQQGKELAQKEREKKQEVTQYKVEILNLRVKLEKQTNIVNSEREEIEKNKNTNQKQLLQSYKKDLQASERKQAELQERLKSSKLTLKQAEDEVLQLQQQLVKKAETEAQLQRLNSEKDEIQNQLQTERRILSETQDSLQKEREKLEKSQTQVQFSKKELQEINYTINQTVLTQNINPQEKIYTLKSDSKHWTKKMNKEPDPERKKIFENMKNFAEDTIDKLLVELNKLPESKKRRKQLKQIARTHEFTRFKRLKNFINRYKLQIGIGTSSVLISTIFGITDILLSLRKSGEQLADTVRDLAHSVKETTKTQQQKPKTQQQKPKTQQQKPAPEDPNLDPILPYALPREIFWGLSAAIFRFLWYLAKNLFYYSGKAAVKVLVWLADIIFWVAGHIVSALVVAFTILLLTRKRQ